MLKIVLGVVSTVIIGCSLFGCTRERVVFPGGDMGSEANIVADSTSPWIELAPDWHSVVIFMRGTHKKGTEYNLLRAEGDSLDFRDISWARLNLNTWDDTNVREGRTYYYKLLGHLKGERILCTASTGITFRSPEYAVRLLERSYDEMDLELLSRLLAEDHQSVGTFRPGEYDTRGKEGEIAIHMKMFGPSVHRTGLKELSLDIGRVVVSRVTEEEDYLGILCFEAIADVSLYVEFDRSVRNRRPAAYQGKEVFRIKHSKDDPTRWVIYRWLDPH